ncbi:hypothetical protein NUU61_003952 [Penicillium alfredii]|uniref:tRNA wybutosine-synthesizing protein 2 n=1 Tax=Penicillium alfredii TaxID=1506179 RepID=A0A9W9KCU1_9EURO|nr:uncharacterized protein NUU61_003952 [Penicillium alfredii]KAJ5101730.1 hypothetical protein NUU61_003952 [Penicillium alfredii]
MDSISQSSDPHRVNSNPGSKKSSRQDRSQRPQRNVNPLQDGIRQFVENHVPASLLSELNLSLDTLTSNLPKRFTIYEPLLLLPANAFSAPPSWGALYTNLNAEQRKELYASIAKASNRKGVTHIAVNAPISLSNAQGQENRMRSPVGLIPLYGDFGPGFMASKLGDESAQPSAEDLEAAFWVRTSQNQGITQIWAPLYTMFSRGNVTEKARILGQGPSGHIFEGLNEQSLHGHTMANISVVDLYAGIGYFVFSYLRRGVKRVWGWELNGWSVEGLRRGCVANRWGYRVVKVLDDGEIDGGVQGLVDGLTDLDRVVIFYGDNRFAADILAKIRSLMETQETWNPVRHVNLGLLPSSQPSWDNACRMLDLQSGGWLHVHENVDIREIDQKKRDIVEEISRLRTRVAGEQAALYEPVAHCCHVEHVKTYAPGVMHCVFDIRVSDKKNI